MAAGVRWLALLLSLPLACDDGSPPAASNGALAGAGASGAAVGRGAAEAAAEPLLERAPAAAAPPCPGPGCSVLSLTPAPDAADPFRQRLVLHGDSSISPRFRSAGRCASLGPDLAYDLDLRAFAEPVRVYLGVHASFDSSLRVERGPEADPFVIDCNEDHVPGIGDAFLALTLPPERYRVVADGEALADGGPIELVVELPSRAGLCRQAPPNDRCEQATPVDLTAGPQVFVGTTECATDQADSPWECGGFVDRVGEVLYALDLTDRQSPVRLHATTDVEPRGADTNLFLVRDAGVCAETLLCNDDADRGALSSELWARLEPGRYFLAVEGPALLEDNAGTPVDFGLQVSVDAEACVAGNDTCRTAEELAPTLGHQSFTVWPMCGDDTLDVSCGIGPSPDIFYRLDLSGFPGLVHVRVTTQRAGAPFENLALLASAEDNCGAELWCGDFDLWLEPAPYYLALDGFRDQQGPVQLELDIDTAAPPAAASCIDESVAECAREQGCCRGDYIECWLVFVSCGLERAALDCLCAADPACCEAGGDSTECGTHLLECGTFCPGFDPLVSCPERP